ncbi:4Fe-4S binding protein [archaeon]|nr:4Fe-4S binding protein [archaeon]
MKQEITEFAEDTIIGFTRAPPDSDFESAIVIGAPSLEMLEGLTRQIKMYLTTKGHFAEEVSSIEEGIDIKRLATSASLGAIGKSTLVITPEFGPRARFSVILTDAVIDVDEPREFDFCKDCNACIEACPAGAITDSGYDRAACEHTRGNICVLCIAACPVGKGK